MRESRRKASLWFTALSSTRRMRSGCRVACSGIEVVRARTWGGPLGNGVRGGCSGRDHDAELLPRPAPSLSAQMVPPIASARRLEIARPRPVPPKRRLIDASVWLKDWNSRSTRSGGMPIPVVADGDVQLDLPSLSGRGAFGRRRDAAGLRELHSVV